MSRRNDTIKAIAMITMLIDHIGVLLFPSVRVLRTIGRIAFPIFAYQVAKGYKHTRDKKKYSLRMLLFGLISQIPYIFLDTDLELHVFHLNVILLFLYSLGVLYLFDLSKSYRELYKKIPLWLLTVISILIPNILENNFEQFAFSYASYGILMILIFYIFDEKWIQITISYIVLTLIATYDSAVSYISMHSLDWWGVEYSYFDVFKRYDYVKDFLIQYDIKKIEIFWFQARSLLALPIILLQKYFYNIRLNKYVAYTFYPLHITILLIIRLIIGHPIM